MGCWAGPMTEECDLHEVGGRKAAGFWPSHLCAVPTVPSLLDTQQPWKDILVAPNQWQSMGTGRVVIPVHWQGCGLQQCPQPWDSAQNVSGAVRVCILPALLSWVDWAVPARLVLWLGCSVQVVLEPRVAGRMFSTLP